jgi:hypothetical protein
MREDKEGFVYSELPHDAMLKRLDEFKALLNGFNSVYKGSFGDMTYSIPLIYEIYRRIDQRADYYLYFHSDQEKPMEMSQTKEIALMVFWILKYKPLSLPLFKANKLFQDKNCTINEFFVVYCLYSCAKEKSTRADIDVYFSPKKIDNLVYSFMHRDISKEAMILLVDSVLNIEEK